MVEIDKFYFFERKLAPLEIKSLASPQNVNKTSILTSEGPPLKILCFSTPSSVRLFENGVQRYFLKREYAKGFENTGVSFHISTVGNLSYNVALGSVNIHEIPSTEQPTYCASTGSYYQFFRQPGISFESARQLATSKHYFGTSGHLATVASADELDCIIRETECSAVWVGALATYGELTWVEGILQGQKLPDHLLSVLPSNSSGGLLLHGAGCKGEDGRLGGAITCRGVCSDTHGYVVKYPTPEVHAIEYADYGKGARVQNVSSIRSTEDWTPNATHGMHTLLNNLLRTAKEPATISRRKLFEFADDDPHQVLQLDLGKPRPLNQIGAEVEQQFLSRAVVGFVEFATASNVDGPWDNWGRIGQDNGKHNIFSTYIYVFRKQGVFARYVKYVFRGGSQGSRIYRLHARQFREAFTRLELNGDDISLDSPGLNIAALVSNSESSLVLRNFVLADRQERESFVRFVNETLPSGAIILAATRGDSPRNVLFQEQWNSRWNSAPGRVVFNDPSLGLLQPHPSISHDGATAYCASQGKVLCPSTALCLPPLDEYPSGYPRFGWVIDGDAWVPVSDEPNSWIAIGQAFPRSELCRHYHKINGDHPSEAVTSQWFRTRLACCEVDPPFPRWRVVNDGNLTLDTPVYWRLDQSRLRSEGVLFGSINPNAPEDMINEMDMKKRLEKEIGSPYKGTSHCILDEPEALRWANYSFSADIHIRDGFPRGLLFRYQDGFNYYRLSSRLVSGDAKYSLEKLENGFADVVDSTTLPLPSYWRRVTITVVGSTIRVLINGDLAFHIFDDRPILRGSIGAFSFHGGKGVLFDNFIVTEAFDIDLSGTISDTLKQISAQGFNPFMRGTWGVIGERGAPEGTATEMYSSSGSLVSVSSMFQCPEYKITIPEKLEQNRVLPLLLPVSRVTPPRRYRLETERNSFSITPVSHQLILESMNASTLEPGSEEQVIVSGSASEFDSGWFLMGSQAGELSFHEVYHGLNVPVEMLDVQVWIRPIEGPNKGYIFKAHGHAQVTDSHYMMRYGGVVFAYSTASVRLWAPSRSYLHSRGSIVNVGGGWGGREDNRNGIGVMLDRHNQESQVAEIRVQVRVDRPADYDSGSFLLYSEADAGSVRSFPHGLKELPGKVKTYAKATAGPNEGFVFLGEGAAHRDHRWYFHRQPVGGLLYHYSTTTITVSAPSHRKQGLEHMIWVGEGWGGDKHASSLNYAEVRVLAWRDREVPDFEVEDKLLSAGAVENYLELEHDLGVYPERVQVRARKGEEGSDTYFEGIGMPQTSGYYQKQRRGGILWAVNETHVRLWAPSPWQYARDVTQDESSAIHQFHPWQEKELSSAALVSVSVEYAWTLLRNPRCFRQVRLWKSWKTVSSKMKLVVSIRDVQEAPNVESVFAKLYENPVENKFLGTMRVTDGDCRGNISACGLSITVLGGNHGNAFRIDDEGNFFVENSTAINYEVRTARVSADAFCGIPIVNLIGA